MDWSALPPLSMIRAFEAAARTGGFSAAGRELNVTHAAVAQQVRALEARLGLRLMRREGRGVVLTPEGQRLAQGLGRGLETMRHALGEAARDAAGRPVRLTLTPKFSAYWLMPRLARFRAAHPDIELLVSPTPELVDLATGAFDLAIRFGQGGWPVAEAELLVPSAHVVVATPALLERHPVHEPADLLDIPWVQETETDEWFTWLTAHGVTPRPKHDVLHLPGYMALAAMRSGEGAGLTARNFVQAEIEAGSLVALFDEPGAPETGYWLIQAPHPGGTPRQTLRAVVEWLRAEAAAERAGTGMLDAAPQNGR
ncbi:MAG: LysR substrate-binding domain-containing protein [Pseudomonadota bacterium]